MIVHISIAAYEPEKVARVLAALTQTEYKPFPITEGAFMVTSRSMSFLA